MINIADANNSATVGHPLTTALGVGIEFWRRGWLHSDWTNWCFATDNACHFACEHKFEEFDEFNPESTLWHLHVEARDFNDNFRPDPFAEDGVMRCWSPRLEYL